MKFKSKWLALVGMLVIGAASLGIAGRSTYFQRFTVGGNQKYVLETDGTITQTGALQFGNNEDNVTTLPTTTTADSFGVKVPAKNTMTATTVRGQVAIVNTTSTVVGAAVVASVASTTTWIGIWDGAYTANTIGWVTVSGYAAALTTGTVVSGDVLVTTNTSVGYLGVAPSTSAASASIVGHALTAGTAAGGLTVIRLGN